MTCPEMKNNLVESVFESRPLTEDARKHLAECGGCATELKQMEATWKLLDEWQAPEPSAFFDAKLYARLRTEQSNAPASFFERAKVWLLYSSNLQMRQLTAGALGAVLVIGGIGGGTFALLGHQEKPVPQTSATVIFQQLNALDSDEDSGTGSSN
jgi:hypothetical protein